MGPQEIDNLIAAVRSGQPTVIFEDPFTVFAQEVPGTSQPRHPPDQMLAMFNRQPMPKGNIKPLWKLLGVGFSGDEKSDEFQPFAGDEEGMGGSDRIVCQNYNPYPKLSDIPAEFVFIDSGCGNKGSPFGEDDPISSKLQHLFLPAPGTSRSGTPRSWARAASSCRWSRPACGAAPSAQRDDHGPFGRIFNPYRRRSPANAEFTLAAHITGRLRRGGRGRRRQARTQGQGRKAGRDRRERGPRGRHRHAGRRVLPLARAGRSAGLGLRFDFDNVTLVLNALDSLAGDQRFLELRKRRPLHRTLAALRAADRRGPQGKPRPATAASMRQGRQQQEERRQGQATGSRSSDSGSRRTRGSSRRNGENRVATPADGQHRLDQLKQETEAEVQPGDRRDRRPARREDPGEQDWYKMWAVVLPAVPAGDGRVVFLDRRAGGGGAKASGERLR